MEQKTFNSRERKKKMKKKLVNFKTALQTAATVALMGLPVHADMSIESVTVNSDMDVNTIFGSVVGLVLFMFQLVGAVALIFGIVQVVQTLGDNNGDQRQKGIIASVVGIFLICLKFILQAMGIIG